MREMYQKVSVPPSSLHGHNCDEQIVVNGKMFRRFEARPHLHPLLQEPPGLSRETSWETVIIPKQTVMGILFIVTAYILTKSS